jgi:hypothetical protein
VTLLVRLRILPHFPWRAGGHWLVPVVKVARAVEPREHALTATEIGVGRVSPAAVLPRATWLCPAPPRPPRDSRSLSQLSPDSLQREPDVIREWVERVHENKELGEQWYRRIRHPSSTACHAQELHLPRRYCAAHSRHI